MINRIADSKLVESVRDLFPPESVIEAIRTGSGLNIRIDLPAGEAGTARSINLGISKEAIDDYLARDEYLELAKERLRSFVRDRLAAFKPNTKSTSTRDEKWKVTTHLFDDL